MDPDNVVENATNGDQRTDHHLPGAQGRPMGDGRPMDDGPRHEHVRNNEVRSDDDRCRGNEGRRNDDTQVCVTLSHTNSCAIGTRVSDLDHPAHRPSRILSGPRAASLPRRRRLNRPEQHKDLPTLHLLCRVLACEHPRFGASARVPVRAGQPGLGARTSRVARPEGLVCEAVNLCSLRKAVQ